MIDKGAMSSPFRRGEGIHLATEVIDLEIAETVDRLSGSFAGVGREQVERAVADAVERLRPAGVTTFIPVLAERRARERLQELSVTRVTQGDERP